MAKDDWRLRIELQEEHSYPLLERLGLVKDDADELAKELTNSRLAVTHDSDTVFVYAASALELEKAQAVVERELEELNLRPDALITEHWLAGEERWDDQPVSADPDEEVAGEGYAAWEVRIPCKSHAAAEKLADELEAEGYGVVRRWSYVIAGTGTKEDAEALAKRLHGEVEAGGEVVYDAVRIHPFTIF